MSVSPAERDSLRERAFAMAMQKVPYREIARRLDINKSTVVEYVRIERQRRSHDREAEDTIREVVASLRYFMTDLYNRYDKVQGDGPHAQYARVKIAEQVSHLGR